MESLIYAATEKFVVESFSSIGKQSQIPHFVRTVHWIQELRPNADEALLVAAVAHDIERAYRKRDVLEKKNSTSFTSPDFYRPHEERGAEIVADFLRRNNVVEDFVERVRMLISRHEEGGNDDQNLLKDADSISFFENNLSFFTDVNLSGSDAEKSKEKIDWMFFRITSDRAREMALVFYKKTRT